MASPQAPQWPAGSVVAVTKLHAPDPRAAIVPRDALVGLLGGPPGTRLTLVTGPPGAGKTTLLAQWHASEREHRAFAWLSLDPEDADPVRFWRCLLEAMRTVHPGFGAQAEAALRAAPTALTEAVVPLVVNAAARLARPTVLVLDDLHAVGDGGDVHRSLGLLLDRLPGALQLAIASRTEPSLPLGRLRARGQLVELRTGDLRFSDSEAAALLHRGFGVELAGGQLARLQQRTEGWAAGLQLAGLWLGRRNADFEAFMAAFGGREREVLDYLGAELLDVLPAALRDFLLETAILARLSAPVCDAVTGRSDSAAMLDEAERRNLLLVPLDARRTWWRYHHLFAELLRHQLERGRSTEEIAELHTRAAAWHREHGEPSQAIDHALAAGDDELAIELVAEHWEPAFNRGELVTVASWLDRLPAGAVEIHPRLWLARLWTAMDRGQLALADRLLHRAAGADVPEVRAWGTLLHALHAFKSGDLSSAVTRLAGASPGAADDAFWHTVAALLGGLTSYWQRHRPAAIRSFEQAATLAEENGNLLGQAYALGYLALLAAHSADAAGSERLLDRFDAVLAADPGVDEHFVAFVAALARGRLLEQRGSYEAAAVALERALGLSERGAGRLEIAETMLALAGVQRARGRREVSRRLTADAERLLAECADPGRLADRRPEPATPAAEMLSDSELAVLRLLPSDLSQREIGAELFVSLNTVKTHCRHIYAKLHAQSREQAVGRARELGLL